MLQKTIFLEKKFKKQKGQVFDVDKRRKCWEGVKSLKRREKRHRKGHVHTHICINSSRVQSDHESFLESDHNDFF